MVLIKAERNSFALLADLLDLADRVCKDFIPMAKDDKVGRKLSSGMQELCHLRSLQDQMSFQRPDRLCASDFPPSPAGGAAQ